MRVTNVAIIYKTDRVSYNVTIIRKTDCARNQRNNLTAVEAIKQKSHAYVTVKQKTEFASDYHTRKGARFAYVTICNSKRNVPVTIVAIIEKTEGNVRQP